MYCAWKHGGCDPFELYHGPGAGPSPHPSRVATFVMGCALSAEEQEQGVRRRRQVTGE